MTTRNARAHAHTLKNAQALLGRADVGATPIYTGVPTLDEPSAAIRGIRFTKDSERCSTARDAPRQPARGADRNRTGVHGFAGRCVATPPRRRAQRTS